MTIDQKLRSILLSFWDEYEGADTLKEHKQSELKAINAIKQIYKEEVD